MSDLSLTIKLRENLAAITKKHEPKVIVIGADTADKIEYLKPFMQFME